MKRYLPYMMVAGLLMVAAPGVSSAGEEPVVPKFRIDGYNVQGATLLSRDRIADILKPYVGAEKNFGDVQQALEALEDEYRRGGYSTVHVLLPEQELEKGEVRLQVLEGKITRIDVQGNSAFDTGNIRRSLPGLAEGTIPDIDAVSASLNIVNENPAKKVSLQLQSGEKEDDLIARLKVTDERPWRFGFTTENTGSAQTGDWRVGAMFQHANLFNLDHILTLQYITSTEKPSRVNIYSAGYRIPVYGWGDSIDLFGGYSDVDSGTMSTTDFGDLTVSGKGIVSGIRYNQNLARLGPWKHRLVYGFDYRIYENDVDLNGSPHDSEVAVHPVSLTYAGDWTDEAFTFGSFVSFIQNVPGKGENADFETARGGARADYRLLRYGATLGVALPGDWQERLIFSGQYTDNRLVPGEQSGLGGASSIRGFQEREVAGDWGHSATQELFSPDLARFLGFSNTQLRLLGFFDIGHIVKVSRGQSDPYDTVIAGGGVGFRLAIGKTLSVSFDYGIVALEGGTREQGDDKIHLKASLVF